MPVICSMNTEPQQDRACREPDRVRRHTAPEVNDRIDECVEKSVRFYAAQPREAISRRIRELEREWDIERTLETNAASVGLAGFAAALVGRRAWIGLPFVVLGFLLMHGVQGWCPPLPVFRRLGIRTRREIDREKYALKYLRGDFDDLRRPGAEQDHTGPLVEATAR
jgi:hypothetical protein